MHFLKDLMQESIVTLQQLYLKLMGKESIIYINDDTLINNFYGILKHEYAFDAIFEKIGINPNFNINLNEVKKINQWLKNNDSETDPKIELIRQFENFRAISKDPEKFEDQIKSAAQLFELIIDAVNISKECDLKFLDYKENLDYLKNSQDFFFKLEYFKRDNLVHPLRVFLLGCYIIYSDTDFWIDRIMESVKKDLYSTSDILFGPIFLKLALSTKDFRLKLLFLMWMVASLCHDIGRSIEDANETIKKVTITYGKLPKFCWSYIDISSGSRESSELELSSLCIKPDEIGEKKIKALFAFLEWIKPEYLFNWKEIPGKDSGRLIDLLKQNYSIDWVKTAIIEKIDNDKTIKVSAGKNYISLSLNNEKTKVNLEIDDGRTDEFIANTIIGKLKIYKPIKRQYIERIMKEKYKNRDHGMISAILATNYEYLKYFEENAYIQIFKNPVPFLCYLLIHYSFISISLHDSERYFFTSPLTQLFIAVDTLQEWDRITKIGDIKRVIYPCDRIELKFDDLKGSKGKVIEAIIPFDEPNDDLIKEIFDRRKTDHEDLVIELTKAQDEKLFNDFFDKGVELRIGYLETKSKEILKLKICGFCGWITSRTEKGFNRDMNNLICRNSKCESHERK